MRGVDGQMRRLMIVFIIIGSIVIVILFVRPHHSQHVGAVAIDGQSLMMARSQTDSGGKLGEEKV